MSRRLRKPKRDLMTRLLDKTRRNPANGCWEWQGSRRNGGFGYGEIRVTSDRKAQAHRVSYTLFCGPIPDGLMLLHSCDNPRCINPDHLRPGTHADNQRDKIEKNRQKGKGANWPKELRDQIRAEIDAGTPLVLIAKRYGVGYRSLCLHAKKYRNAKRDAMTVA
jgi:hypothetical protein